MRGNWLDRAIGVVAPRAALGRARARMALEATDRTSKRSYDAGSQGRLTTSWVAESASADSEIFNASRMLRDRSRDLTRNNPHGAKAVASLAANIVGTGIMPRPKTGDPKRDKAISTLFERWSRQCDAGGQLDFYGMQTLVVREMIEAGEVLIRRRRRKSTDPLDVPLQLQILEADYLDPTRNGLQDNKNLAKQGIEFTPIGARAAYWLYSQHPGDFFFGLTGSLTSKPVPSTEVLHVYEMQRSQVRGVPWGAPAMRDLQDLADYEYAELIRKKLEASAVGVVTTDDDTEIGVNRDPTATTADFDQPAGMFDGQGAPIERFEPGMFVYARGGKTVTFNTPASIGGYNEYKVSKLRSIAAGYRLPYECMSSDLSQVNFSSMRSGLNEFRRFVQAVQWQILVPMYLHPVWDWFCEAAYLAGEIDTVTVPVEWSTPRFEWVNPADDVAADLMAIRSGLRSWQDVVAESGRDPIDVLAEIGEFQEHCRQKGIVLDSDPSAVSGRGVAQKNGPPDKTAPDSLDRTHSPLADRAIADMAERIADQSAE